MSYLLKRAITGDEREHHLAACKNVADQLQQLEEQLKLVSEQTEALMLFVPSLPAADVPEGESDLDNV